jgi:hypothetical protein
LARYGNDNPNEVVDEVIFAFWYGNIRNSPVVVVGDVVIFV